MSRSKAQKYRQKQIREGRIDPAKLRSPYSELDLQTRKTKTKKDHLYRTKHQNRYPDHQGDGSFLCLFLEKLLTFCESHTQQRIVLSYIGRECAHGGPLSYMD